MLHSLRNKLKGNFAKKAKTFAFFGERTKCENEANGGEIFAKRLFHFAGNPNINTMKTTFDINFDFNSMDTHKHGNKKSCQ